MRSLYERKQTVTEEGDSVVNMHDAITSFLQPLGVAMTDDSCQDMVYSEQWNVKHGGGRIDKCKPTMICAADTVRQSVEAVFGPG